MRRLGEIVARITKARRAQEASAAANHNHRLKELTEFGSNPGNLIARTFVPETIKPHAPLVVVLHGCTQNAALYDTGSGWSELAKREGFALLYPEQQRSNNANLCLNWYQPGDAGRDKGEAKSISQMIARMVAEYGLDASRVFVTGLSAGGAMASVMLATYPDLFAGGAVIAGLPFASATTLPEALARMRGHGAPSAKALASRARSAASHSGPMPSLSVWHGTQDTIVDPANAGELIDQWRGLYGLEASPGTVEQIGKHRREVWCDGAGRAVIERYDIEGIGHGTPLATGGMDALGVAGPHMLEAGISSTQRIAEFWGLSEERRTDAPSVNDTGVPATKLQPERPLKPRLSAQTDPAIVIEKALRAAGLMR